MEYNKIIDDIAAKLTGDSDADIAYLKSKMEKYKDHPLSTEIIRACSRLLFDLLPENKKNEINNIIENQSIAWSQVLEEVRFQRYKHNNEKALSLLTPLVDMAEQCIAAGMYSDDSTSTYLCLSEPFEYVLYDYIYNKPQKEIRYPGNIPFASIYLEHGSLLIDLKRIEDARSALAKAVRWNPIDCSIAFEYAETFKMLGDFDSFLDITLKTYQTAFSPMTLARYYRNLGFYFVEKKLWREAVGCIYASMEYDRTSTNAQSELYYINDMTKGKVVIPTTDELREYGKQYDFSIGANKDVLGLAYSLGRQCYAANQWDNARYFLNIVNNLVNDDSLKTMIDCIPSVT